MTWNGRVHIQKSQVYLIYIYIYICNLEGKRKKKNRNLEKQDSCTQLVLKLKYRDPKGFWEHRAQHKWPPPLKKLKGIINPLGFD